MEILVTPHAHTTEQKIALNKFQKKAIATAHQVRKLHFPNNSNIQFIRGSYCRTAINDIYGYVCQFAITMDSDVKPKYSLYIYHDVEDDVITMFIGMYGQLGAVTFHAVQGYTNLSWFDREIERANFMDNYDVKFVFTYNFKALPEGVLN